MMKVTMHAYSTLLTCCLLLTLAAGDTLIVAMDGTGTDCTLDDPCGSIQQAIDISQAGGKIQIGAGTFVENLTLNITKTGLSIEGRSMSETIIESAGGNEGQMAPAGVPVDIIVDIFATDVKISNIMLVHSEAEATKRDIGVFVRPPALNAVLENINVQRSRTGDNVEPFAPGSRGLLVLQATGTKCSSSKFEGNYEDHIHLPTSNATITGTTADGATRLGVVVIQEAPDTLSTGNIIDRCVVKNSGSDGIQIQGDFNSITATSVSNSGGFGVHVCIDDGTCVAPGMLANATNNVIEIDMISTNNVLGRIKYDESVENEIISDDGSSSFRPALLLPGVVVVLGGILVAIL